MTVPVAVGIPITVGLSGDGGSADNSTAGDNNGSSTAEMLTDVQQQQVRHVQQAVIQVAIQETQQVEQTQIQATAR